MIAPSDIEVGASRTDGKLRFWLAKEALRQGELRLSAQATARTALEARATALTGWAAAALLALVAAAAASQDIPAQLAAVAPAASLFSAAGLGVHAARPRSWSLAGYNPETLGLITLATELEILEALGEGIARQVARNERNLTAMSRLLVAAGWLLILTPALGVAAYFVLHSSTLAWIRTGSGVPRSELALAAAVALPCT